ncbi:DUF2878 domain-containing protein [bacterium]|nr:DUF2878 domain-containing protein [bacterium]
MRFGRGLNFALYYAGWFACVLGPAWGYPWTGTAIALAFVACHLALVRRRRDELALMATAAVIGLVADTLQIAAGLLRFPTGTLFGVLPPVWLIVLWAQFAATFHYSLQWLQGRPWTAALFGACGGPLAFLAGQRLGVVAFHPAMWRSLLSLGVVWAIAMPLLLAVAARQRGREGVGQYRSWRRAAA